MLGRRSLLPAIAIAAIAIAPQNAVAVRSTRRSSASAAITSETGGRSGRR